MMLRAQRTSMLRRVLLADALISGATGLLMIGGASLLASVLALPQPLLRYAGLALLPFAALVLAVGRREHPQRWAVWTVIGINVAWALSSIGLLVSGAVAPNWLGYNFVLFQAVVVGVFGELQVLALRRWTFQPV